MKRLNYLFVIVALFVLSTGVANATGTRTEFNDFEISQLQDLHLGKQVQAVWTLRYSPDETPVTVIKRKTLEGIEYRVQSEYFSVCYLATNVGFGVKAAKQSWSSVPKKINHAVLNQNQLLNQQVITPNKVDDKTALGLIACYLPDLINDGYTHLLN